jgi:hypothetical protein
LSNDTLEMFPAGIESPVRGIFSARGRVAIYCKIDIRMRASICFPALVLVPLALARQAQGRGGGLAALSPISGFVLNKNETQFASVYWDRYAQIKRGDF